MMATEDSGRALAKELWELLKPIRGTAKNWDSVNQWLWKTEILDGSNPDESMPNLPPAKIHQVIDAARNHADIKQP